MTDVNLRCSVNLRCGIIEDKYKMNTPINPYRPAAGHQPPYLAGRNKEKEEFQKLLEQEIVIKNLIISGLRGSGKTVLLSHIKPAAEEAGWLWTGEDLTEQASISEEGIAVRIMADLATLLSSIFGTKTASIGFINEENKKHKPNVQYDQLINIFNEAPGLVSDKLKAVLRFVGKAVKNTSFKGIVFAYDEAQNMRDHAQKEQYPLSLLLDVFQSLQRQPDNLPFILVLTGLPTLFPKLIETRTYSERMFSTIFLDKLSPEESRKAITKPVEKIKEILFDDKTIEEIIKLADGYPYFIQFICKEVFDVLSVRARAFSVIGEFAPIPFEAILQKLDQDFFASRWQRISENQKDFLGVIAQIPNCQNGFTVAQIVRLAEKNQTKKYSSSSATQFLNRLIELGFIYKTKRGQYRFAVPMLAEFIRRQTETKNGLGL